VYCSQWESHRICEKIKPGRHGSHFYECLQAQINRQKYRNVINLYYMIYCPEELRSSGQLLLEIMQSQIKMAFD